MKVIAVALAALILSGCSLERDPNQHLPAKELAEYDAASQIFESFEYCDTNGLPGFTWPSVCLYTKGKSEIENIGYDDDNCPRTAFYFQDNGINFYLSDMDKPNYSRGGLVSCINNMLKKGIEKYNESIAAASKRRNIEETNKASWGS